MNDIIADDTLEAQTSEAHEPRIDWSVFLPAIFMIGSLAAALIIFPDISGPKAEALKTSITHNLGWLFLMFGVFALIFCGWLAFGPFGHVKLGDADEPPEYSSLHWIAMMFTAGVGAGVIVWGFAEPMFYLQSPPFGIEAFSNEAVEWAHMYPLFHWGILPWAMFAVPAVPIGYLLYVKKAKIMRVSSACDGALPKTGRGFMKAVIDIFIIFGIIGGNATALGLGIPLVSALTAEFLGIENTIQIKIGLLSIWALLFSISVFNGLKKGIKVLADVNMGLAGVAILFMLFTGPTLFILKMTANSFGLMFTNFAAMSLWTDPIAKSGFPEDWTVFYWTWWLAFAAFIGLFVARISRGRTIRQLIVGVICWGALGTWIFLAVAGGYALHLELSGVMSLTDIINDPDQGMFVMTAKVLAAMPFGKIVLILFIVLSVIFYATNVDSAAYVLASVCSKNLRSDQEPGRFNRLIWALVLVVFTVGLIISDTISIIQSATIISALPLIPIILLMCVSLTKWLYADFGASIKNAQLSLKGPPENNK